MLARECTLYSDSKQFSDSSSSNICMRAATEAEVGGREGVHRLITAQAADQVATAATATRLDSNNYCNNYCSSSSSSSNVCGNSNINSSNIFTMRGSN